MKKVSEYTIKQRVLIVALYFARLESKDERYEKRHEYFGILNEAYGFKKSTLKQRKDDFDPYFENGRKGYWQVSLEKKSKDIQMVYNEYKDVPIEELEEFITEIINAAKIDSKSEFFTIKTKTPAQVNNIKQLNNPVEIDQLNILQDQLKIGQLVFIVFGGDKGRPEVVWETGLSAIGRIVKSPYDVGYGGNSKNYRIQINVEYLLPSPLAREGFLNYKDAYNAIGIGPMTKWEPNQAISKIDYSGAVAVVRAIIDKFAGSVDKVTDMFGENFMAKVKSEVVYLLPQKYEYGENIKELISVTSMEDREYSELFEPDFHSLLDGLEMDERPFEVFKAHINSGKHIILSGPPGTGKTTIAQRLADEAGKVYYCDGYIITTATADWSTFDTIGGYMPDLGGKLIFNEGIILKSIRENKWVVVDEINRADVDKAFGQLLSILSGKDAELPYKDREGRSIQIRCWQNPNSLYDADNGVYRVGKNWRMIGTMNTFDKNSLFTLSYAFMRRFAFVSIPIPSEEYTDRLIDSAEIPDTAKTLVKHLRGISPRPLGPAILADLMNFMGNVGEELYADGICALVVQQFEGLGRNQIREFYKNILNKLSPDSGKVLKEYLCESFDIQISELQKIDRELGISSAQDQDTENVIGDGTDAD